MSLSDKDDDEILELAKRIEEYEKIHFPIPEPDEIEETVSLEDAAKMLGPIAPSDMKDFQAQMRASRVQDNFHKSLKAYAETLWGPIGVDAEFEASVKAYAERKWGPFASDIPSHPMPDPIIACEKVVEEFTPEPVERLATDYGDLQTVFVLKWSWHYGEESKEFNNLQDALNYPATVIAYFNEFDFSAAGWELFKRKQSDDVKLEGNYELKLTLDREKKNG